VDIEVVWRTPIRLRAAPKGARQDYVIPERSEMRLPKAPGVYVFCRKFGANYEPLYIGQADNLHTRINQHLKTNVPLMRALRDAKSGARSILVGEIITKKGQQIKRVLDIVEPTLIAEAVAHRNTLVNRQLTSSRFHSIVSGGPTAARGPFSRSYSVPIT
jgi:hypothetical protein